MRQTAVDVAQLYCYAVVPNPSSMSNMSSDVSLFLDARSFNYQARQGLLPVTGGQGLSRLHASVAPPTCLVAEHRIKAAAGLGPTRLRGVLHLHCKCAWRVGRPQTARRQPAAAGWSSWPAGLQRTTDWHCSCCCCSAALAGRRWAGSPVGQS